MRPIVPNPSRETPPLLYADELGRRQATESVLICRARLGIARPRVRELALLDLPIQRKGDQARREHLKASSPSR